MFLCRIVFCLYHSAPEGAAVVYINNSHISSSGLHYTSMGHARLVCTHLYIISYLGDSRIYRFLSSPMDCSIRPHSCSLLQHSAFSQRNIDEFRLYVLLLTSFIRGHLLSLKFRPHRATRTPHHQHRKTVIHGTRINSTAKKGPKLYKIG
jgi:hypothetical protein